MTPDIPDLGHIDHCLRIVDAFLIGSWSPALGFEQLDAERENLATGLVALCAVLSLVNSEIEQHHSSKLLATLLKFNLSIKIICITALCIESGFRVLINLSHLSAAWCQLLIADPLFPTVIVREVLSQSDWVVKEGVGESEDKDAGIKKGLLDRHCLALALLSNVVLAVDETKCLFRKIGQYSYWLALILLCDTHAVWSVFNPSCRGGRRCALSCRCSMRLTAIECFVSFFVKTNIKPESSVCADFIVIFPVYK